ncbi:hypothetical protein JCM6882_006618 [Rhodosporidiobolus microsporus]
MAASAVTNGATSRTTRSEAAPSSSSKNALDASARQNGDGDDQGGSDDGEVVKRDKEVSDGPAGNWEVAYVYSFLHSFTDLIDPEEDAFPSVMAFEDALLSCSPAFDAEFSAAALSKPLTSLPGPSAKDKANAASSNSNGKKSAAAATKNGKGGARAGSPASSLSSLDESDDGADWVDPFEAHSASAPVFRASVEPIDGFGPPRPVLADGETFDVPPHSELVKNVMLELNGILSQLKELTDYHGKKTWFHFLINFVTQRLQSDAYFGGFRWRANLLRTRGLKPGQEDEKNFWMLRWEDKVHLMRQMIDFMLVGVPSIRDKIKDSYDLGNQRIAKRDPESNPLVLLPLGRTSTLLTIYHLDTSPRLYASGAPYKPSAPWVAVSSTLSGYKAFIESLAEPAKADRKKVALKGPFAKAAGSSLGGWGGEGKIGGAKKAKGKEEERDGKEEERVLRARLEARLGEIEQWEEQQQVLIARAARAAERAATRDARVARNISRLGAGTTTRSSRLRTRAEAGETAGSVNYAEEDEDDDGMGVGRRKRRRVEDDAFSYGEGGEGEDGTPGAGDNESVASGSRRGGRRSAASTLPPAIPGERSSRRLQGVRADVTPAADEVVEETPAAEDVKPEQPNGDVAAPAPADAEVKAVETGAGASALQVEANGVEEEKEAKPMDVDVAPLAAPEGLQGEVEAKKEESGEVKEVA